MVPGIGSIAAQLQQQLANSLTLPFLDLFENSPFFSFVESSPRKGRNRIYTSIVTLLAFIAQVLDSDHSCSRAVSRVINYLGLFGRAQPSTDTSAYCQARLRLSESWLIEVLKWTWLRMAEDMTEDRLWLTRHRVFSSDGSSTQTPDTPANREAFGLPGSVKPGCGFPVLPFAGMFCLASGLLVDVLFGCKGGHERHLFRALWKGLRSGDVALTDRGGCSYADVALLRLRGVYCVFRIFNRKPDYRKGKSLGRHDHIVEWKKPIKPPRGMSKEEFDKLPDTITVRELRIVVTRKGFRSRNIDVVTTLLDDDYYTKDALAALYRRRWEIEINLRHIKTTLGMEMISTKTPSMCRKEVLVYMLAYNLIRTLMWETAKQYQIDPIRLSFKGALHHFSILSPYLGVASPEQLQIFYEHLLRRIAQEVVPYRPNRIEPRVVKRRPKPYPLMTKPRAVLRAMLVA